MVLADNVDGGDDLDLIVTTMNGNVLCFSTPAPHHPLKARYIYNIGYSGMSTTKANKELVCVILYFQSWRAPNQGRNNVVNRYNREGVYVTPSSRAFRDEEGKSFWVEIEIVDRYRFPSGSQAPYNVTVTFISLSQNYVVYIS